MRYMRMFLSVVSTTFCSCLLLSLLASLQSWRDEGRIAAWLIVPINCSHLIPAAVKCGFLFHHAEGSKAVLKLWLDCSKDDATPQFATHQVGVSGVYACIIQNYTYNYNLLSLNIKMAIRQHNSCRIIKIIITF